MKNNIDVKNCKMKNSIDVKNCKMKNSIDVKNCKMKNSINVKNCKKWWKYKLRDLKKEINLRDLLFKITIYSAIQLFFQSYWSKYILMGFILLFFIHFSHLYYLINETKPKLN